MIRFLVSVLLCVLCAVGCGHVAPYQREQLAKPTMNLEREELRGRFYAHVYDAREGAIGNTDSAGGGCGCN